MKCASCQHENTVGAKFCEECAAPLGKSCDSCGTFASSTAKFCPECGCPLNPVTSPRLDSPNGHTLGRLADNILRSRAEFEDERKQVTVLFADITDSSDLVATHDAEVVRKLFLNPILERMIEAVHYYGGTLYSVRGDGIMALFGTPLALEDHAVRGCYAGLRMQESVGRHAEELQRSHRVSIKIRVGLASGEIVEHIINNDPNRDNNVVGQTAWLASRMEQMATPGSILATMETFDLAEGYVAMKPLGFVAVKGFPVPVQVHEVTGPGAARNRLHISTRRGLTRFVGRDIELQQLRRALRRGRDSGGQVVAIVGEAGVGKSRLAHEFLHSSHTTEWLVLEASSTAYAHSTPYLPITGLLHHYFKIDSHDGKRLIHEKVTDKIMTLDPALRETIPPLLDLLDGLNDGHPFRSLDPLMHRRQTYQAVIQLLMTESRNRPVVAVVEDLHWNDALTLGLLNELVVAAQQSCFVLLVTYRPNYTDEWKNRPNYLQLRLNPLAAESLADLLQSLLGSDQGLAALKSFLVERASGNPFFLEEIVRSFVDTGVLEGERGRYRLARPFSNTDVPPTVRAVLAARIDSLPAAEKQLLQMASVVGREVPFTLLNAISGLKDDRLRRLLDNLQTAELLLTTRLFPDVQYTFKHYLTHEVTYSAVLRERRREIHARVVDAIEKLHGDRLSEHVDRLAHHAVQGELQEKAVSYLRQAGGRAAARFALSDARVWFEQALNILSALPESKILLELAFEIHLEVRAVLRQLGAVRQMLEHLRQAEAIAERLEDDYRRCQVCAFITNVQSTLGELDSALVTGARALEFASRLGDPRLRIVTISALEQACHYRGEYVRVAESAPRDLTALPADWSHEFFGMAVPASVFVRAWLIMSLAELGRFVEAYKYVEEAIQIAEPTQHAHTIGWAHLAAAMLHLVKGNWAKALSRIEPWISMFRTGNVVMHLPWAIASFAWALAEIGEGSEALIRVHEAEELLDQQAAMGIVGHCGWAYHSVGRACLLLGQFDEARRLGHRSVELSRGHPGFMAYALRLLGDLVTCSDQLAAESGVAYYQQALSLAELHRMRPLVARCHLGMGQLYLRTDKSNDAREHLTTAIRMHREMDLEFRLGQEEADIIVDELEKHAN